MKKLCLLFVGLGLILACGRETVTDIYHSVPDRIQEWEASGEDAFYDRTTLFDYMNGGAEVYLAFDFRRAFVRRYQRGEGEEISLDIYDMGSPAEAFGVFSCDREDQEAGIGQGSEYGFGLLRFWKGRYFVSIMAGEEGEDVDRAVLELGRAVDGILLEEGREPEVLKMLPQTGLRPDRTSFFHSNVNLNNRFFIAAENILRLGRETDCVLAEFGPRDEEPVILLIVRYPDAALANEAHGSFLESYMPESAETGVAETEDGRWTLARIADSVVSIVFGAPDEASARDLQSEIRFD
jgi:hypothetical protein